MMSRFSGPPLIVVKLGGSLMDTGSIDDALTQIFSAPISPVIVPGGGMFAEGVRNAQHAIGFSEELAHHLAVEAMASFGKVLAERDERLVLFDDLGSFEAVRRSGAVPVWDPVPMIDVAPEIPKSWDVTSDSLAAYLAIKLNADGLVLIKSVDVEHGANVMDLARNGVVDPLFPAFAAQFAKPVAILGPAGIGRKVQSLSEFGTAIAL